MNETPIIQFKNVYKSFASTIAANDLTFKILKGTVHGIIGENGAGKSTAMKMLYGMCAPDRGSIYVHGAQTHFKTAADAVQAGIGMVHQHFMLAEPFSALDNLILFQNKKNLFSSLNRKQWFKKFAGIATDYGFQIDFNKNVTDLSVGEQQRLEILKVLSLGSNIIILDEPTAVLTPQEVESFFANIQKLKASGKTILLITHKLYETKKITDYVTVFRQGQALKTVRTEEESTDSLAKLMIGDNLIPTSFNLPVPNETNKLVRLTNVSGSTHSSKIENINIKVSASEIVGIAGVEGNGQDALIETLLNPSFVDHLRGEVQIAGQKTLKLSSKQIRSLGVAALAEDRIRLGMISTMPLSENLLLGKHQNPRFLKSGFYDKQLIQNECQTLVSNYNVQPPKIDKAIGTFSGGNQQKFIVAKELGHPPQFLLAAQPSRGVDILAKAQIHNEIIKAAHSGTAVLLISSDIEELFTLSHRILVLYRGTIIREFVRSHFNEKDIGLAMGGL